MGTIKYINIDFSKKCHDKIIAKSNDVKSRFIQFRMLDNQKIIDLTGIIPRVYFLKPDGTEGFNDLGVNDPKNGLAILELSEQMLAVPGTLKMELNLFKDTSRLSNIEFEVNVIKSLTNAFSIVSTNEWQALINGLNSLAEYDSYKNEIKEARKGQPTLGAKIDLIDTSLENIENEIFSKDKLKGICVYLNDSSIQEFKDVFLEYKGYGVNSITLCCSVPYRFGDCSPTPENINWLDELVPYCQSIGLEVIIRSHTSPFGNSGINQDVWFPKDVDKWFTNYLNNCLIPLMNKCISHNVKYFQITNELRMLVFDTYRSRWSTIIATLRSISSSVKLGASMTGEEWLSNCYWGLLDFYGHNTYFQLTLDGLVRPQKEIDKGLYYDMNSINWVERFREKEQQGYDVWITETGCPPRLRALYSPGNPPDKDTFDLKTQEVYYEFLLGVVNNLKCLKSIQLWAMNPISTNMYKLEPSVKQILRKKWGNE